MLEVVGRKCSGKTPPIKFHKIYREILVLESSFWISRRPEGFCKISQNTFSYRTPLVAASASNTVKCIQAIKLATLIKRDHRTGFQTQPFVDPLQNRCFWIIHKIYGRTPVLESLFKWSLKASIHRFSSKFSWKFVNSKSLHISLGSTCVGVFFNRFAGPWTAALLKRDSNTGFFSVKFVNYPITPCRGSINGWFWKTSAPFQKQLYNLQNISSGCLWQFQVSSLQL